MPLCKSTGPVLVRCCQHRYSTGPVLTTNGMFTGLVDMILPSKWKMQKLNFRQNFTILNPSNQIYIYRYTFSCFGGEQLRRFGGEICPLHDNFRKCKPKSLYIDLFCAEHSSNRSNIQCFEINSFLRWEKIRRPFQF